MYTYKLLYNPHLIRGGKGQTPCLQHDTHTTSNTYKPDAVCFSLWWLNNCNIVKAKISQFCLECDSISDKSLKKRLCLVINTKYQYFFIKKHGWYMYVFLDNDEYEYTCSSSREYSLQTLIGCQKTTICGKLCISLHIMVNNAYHNIVVVSYTYRILW